MLTLLNNFCKFPKRRNREFFQPNREFSRDNRETHLRIRERFNSLAAGSNPGVDTENPIRGNDRVADPNCVTIPPHVRDGDIGAVGFPWESSPAYLIRDRDAAYGEVFKRRLRAMGIMDRPTARPPDALCGRTEMSNV